MSVTAQSIQSDSVVKLRSAMPWDLTEEEVGYFVTAVDTDDRSGGVETTTRAISSGEMQLWVWRDEDQICVIVTEVLFHRDNSKEMLVTMLSGNNVVENYLVVSDAVLSKAKDYGCDRMIAFVKPDILDALVESGYERDANYDFDSIYTVIAKEV